jgi:hypothetical protein
MFLPLLLGLTDSLQTYATPPLLRSQLNQRPKEVERVNYAAKIARVCNMTATAHRTR